MSFEQGEKAQATPSGQTSEALSDTALDWIVKLHSGHAGPAEEAAWQAWRNQSAAHEAAALEAEAIWDGLGTAGPRVQRQMRNRQITRRAVLGGGAAALVAGIGMNQLGLLGPHLLAQHRTATGERRDITLQDGTEVAMNARTALSGHFSYSQRQVTLSRGQALFRVAEGDSRSFGIDCAETHLSCRSAAVDVDVLDRSVTIVAHSGQVEIATAGGTRHLSAGQRVRVQDGYRFSGIDLVDAEAASAWQRGKLIFDGRRLADLAAELERYRGGRVVVMGDRLAELAVTGLFDLAEPEEVLDIIQVSLPVRINRVPMLAIIRDA